MPHSYFKKTLSFFTLIAFIFTNASYAAPDYNSLFKNKAALRVPLNSDKLRDEFLEVASAKGTGVAHRGSNSINEAIRLAYDARNKDKETFFVIQENGKPVRGISRYHAAILPATFKAIDSLDASAVKLILTRLERNISEILGLRIRLSTIGKDQIKDTIESALTVLIKDPNDPDNPLIIAKSLNEYNAGHNSPKRKSIYLPRRFIDGLIKEGEMSIVAAAEGHEGFQLAVALALGNKYDERNEVLLDAINNAAEEFECLIAGKSRLGLNSRLDDQILASIACTTRGAQKLQFANSLSQKVTPEHGLSEEDLAEVKDALEEVHASIQSDDSLNGLYKSPSSYVERQKDIARMSALAEEWKDKYNDILIIGGEDSGTHMAFTALTEENRNNLSKAERKGFPRIHFVDMDKVVEIAHRIDLKKAGILVIGNNISNANAATCRYLQEIYGKEGIASRLAIVGDSGKTLGETVPSEKQFSLPEGLGNMDSFFSAAGLLPIVLAGKVREAQDILTGAESAAEDIAGIDLTAPTTGIPAIFMYPEYMHPGIIAALYEKKAKDVSIYCPFSEKLRLFGVWTANQFNLVISGRKGNSLVFQGAVGTRHNHASLQNWQKGHNMFQVITLGVNEFNSNLAAGRSSYNLFRNMSFADLMNFAMEGTEQALADGKRPNLGYRIKKVDGVNLGGLIYTTLYQKLVLSRLLDKMDKGERAQTTVASLEKETENAVASKVVSAEGKPSVIRDASGLSLDYSGALGKDGVTTEEMPEVVADLVDIQMEVAKERLAGKHDYLNLPERMIKEIQSDNFRGIMKDFREFEDVLVIGIGGSSVGAKMCLQALSVPGDRKIPNVYFLESVDPDYIEEITKNIDFTKTGIIVISKTGETMESNTVFAAVKEMMQQSFSSIGQPADYKKNILAITDPDHGLLKKEAKREGYRTLDVPPLVEGRFTVLSAVGIAVIGLKLTDNELLELLEGARDYVNTTELSSDKLKKFVKLDTKKKKTAEESAELQRLGNELKEEAKQKVYNSIGYMYGGLRSQLNLKKQKSLSFVAPFSYRLSGFLDWVIQLWNESYGKPGVKEYTTGAVGLDPEAVVYDKDSEVVTLVNIEDTQAPGLDSTRSGYYRASDSLLRKNNKPVFSLSLPLLDGENPRSFGAFIIALQQAVMVQSKSKLFTKPIIYDNQPGVELAKRSARRMIEQKRGLVGVDVIPHELTEIGSAIGSLGMSASDTIRYEDFNSPEERERALAKLIKSTLTQRSEEASIGSIWMKGEEKPVSVNPNGKYTILINPLDASSNIEKNNGSVTALFAVYDGSQFAKDNLIATFMVVYGPATGLVARVKVGDEFCVYDFILDEKIKSFVQRQRGGRETSLIEMNYKGDELAIWGKVKDWPPALNDFYYKEIYRSGKKVRISESAADLYEMILKGGIIAAPITQCDAVMWGSIIESAGGRSLIMTEDGPISCTELKLGKDSFNPEKQIWAYFGNKDVMERMEQSLRGGENLNPDERKEFYKSNMIVRGPPKSIDTTRENADGKSLESVLSDEIGEDTEIVRIVGHVARVATTTVTPMFSVIGVEEGLGEINLAGDEQVGGDTFTNRTFRNRLLNPGNDQELERRLTAAEETGERLVASDFNGISWVSAFYSEEEDMRYPGNDNAKYLVSFDPLDGSSKVDTFGGVSTILTIWDKGESNDIIGKIGHRDVRGVCFVLYGPQTMLVYASAKSDKVFLFKVDKDGSVSRVGMLKPLPERTEKGLRLAIGGERPDMVPKGKSEIDDLESLITTLEREHEGKAGYSGSMNVDIAGILFGMDSEADGGMYAYPGTVRRPEGRLRLDSELVAMSFITEKLGGSSTNGRKNILDIPVGKLHQHEPFFVGSKILIDKVEKVFGNQANAATMLPEALPLGTAAVGTNL
ncbi:MAG: hypothetical protein NTX47_07440 [Candidatus Omnitrophica bacterium]|nr:hypothetical protein [Candidatus Omnitrophota bacterium]